MKITNAETTTAVTPSDATMIPAIAPGFNSQLEKNPFLLDELNTTEVMLSYIAMTR